MYNWLVEWLFALLVFLVAGWSGRLVCCLVGSVPSFLALRVCDWFGGEVGWLASRLASSFCGLFVCISRFLGRLVGWLAGLLALWAGRQHINPYRFRAGAKEFWYRLMCSCGFGCCVVMGVVS